MVTFRMRTGFSVIPLASAGDLRDFLYHVDALGDPAECRKLAIQRRLRRDAYEELRALAIGFAGNADGGNHAALVFHVAELVAQQAQSPGAPQSLGRFRILQ